MPVAIGIVDPTHQRRSAGGQQIADALRHPRQRRGLVRRAGAQADKRQAEDHRGPGAKAEQQRPADGQPWQQPQPGGADGAHQGDQHRDPTLVAQPMQDQRYRQTGRGGRQLQQAMQRAGLRFAIAHTLQNRRQPADNHVIDQRVDAEEQRYLPGQRRPPDPPVMHGA